jgi:hypothetical protein
MHEYRKDTSTEQNVAVPSFFGETVIPVSLPPISKTQAEKPLLEAHFHLSIEQNETGHSILVFRFALALEIPSEVLNLIGRLFASISPSCPWLIAHPQKNFLMSLL